MVDICARLVADARLQFRDFFARYATKQLALHTPPNLCFSMGIRRFIAVRMAWRGDLEEMTMHGEATAGTHRAESRAQGQETFWIEDQHWSVARLPEAKAQP